MALRIATALSKVEFSSTVQLPVSEPNGHLVKVLKATTAVSGGGFPKLDLVVKILDGAHAGLDCYHSIILNKYGTENLAKFSVAGGNCLNMNSLDIDEQTCVGAKLRLVVIKQVVQEGQEDKGYTKVQRYLCADGSAPKAGGAAVARGPVPPPKAAVPAPAPKPVVSALPAPNVEVDASELEQEDAAPPAPAPTRRVTFSKPQE